MRVPQPAYENHLRRRLMHDFGLSFADAVPDPDGDYQVSLSEDIVVYARLLYDVEGTAWVRVWAVAAEGLQASAKLLREVNEINQRHVGTRALLTESGMLVVAAEVIAGSLEIEDLSIVVARVGEAVDDVGVLVQLVHGKAEAKETRREAGTS